MKYWWLSIFMCPLWIGCQRSEVIEAHIARSPNTFCNPVNLDYRFMKVEDGAGIREAADPVVISFKDTYFLFASKSSGYWYSTDFRDWHYVFIDDSVLPIEDYAPGLFVHDGYLYYVGSTHGKGMLYRSAAPEKGTWEAVKEIWSYWDPAFYVEGDSLYLYYGCSPIDPIYARVLDLHTLVERGEPLPCFNSDQQQHGWERPGEQNELTRRPYIEGAWMTAHGGKYYLQYAAPGTEWKTYADGAYVADSPMGPFHYAENSPVSYKPGGFLGGAGHGCLFQVGKAENYWKAATNAISVRHMFERRISFYPAGFDADALLFTDTYLGDYPLYLPNSPEAESGQFRPGWMLLSQGKPVSVSSALSGYPAVQAVDEDSRTAWVASGNGVDEWYQIDLQEPMSVQAIQVNFDEYGATQQGRVPGIYQSYCLSASLDGQQWYRVADFSEKRTDTPHDYVEFESAFEARYIRFENQAYTVSDHLSLRELRVFGQGHGAKPAAVTGLQVERDGQDPCHATLRWTPIPEAQGYIVRYGTAPDKLYQSFQVFDAQLELTGLNAETDYYYTVDAYNENGITQTKQITQ
ncbi:MAG: discoidin domain-containing protein [Parabacteroides sp.]